MNVLVEDGALKGIAESIRDKTGSDQMYKPGEMPEAIQQIPSGSSGADPDLPVRFYDYDGTLLYSYTIEQIQNLEVLPALPEHEGLIGEGWNWSLENLKSENGPMTVGAHYITDDGVTRIYIYLDTHIHSLTVKFGQSKADGVKIDWGDESPLETSEVVLKNDYTYVEAAHEYENPGMYMISLLPDEDAILTIQGSTFYGAYLVTGKEMSLDQNRLYFSFVKEIEIGRNVVVGTAAFYMMNSLEKISIPMNLSISGQYVFAHCSSMRFVTLPQETCMDDYMLDYCASLYAVAIPNTVETIGYYGLGSCGSLIEVNLPRNVKALGSSCFSSCASLERITSMGKVDSIGSSCFYYATNMKEADILGDGLTKIENSAFNNCPSLHKIDIPAGVKEIGPSAFYITYCLTDMYLYCDTPPSIQSYSINMTAKDFIIHITAKTELLCCISLK